MPFCSSCGLIYPEGRFCPLDGTELADPDDPNLGRVFGGKYRIVSKIGEGGMGVVYRALHEHLGRNLAVKTIRKELSSVEGLKERFFREARAAVMVRHRNVVDIYDLAETEDGILYMVMEFLVGEPLSQATRSGSMTVDRAVPILRQICSALGPLHAMGIIHRDLKPDNIFVVGKDVVRDLVKILDFGIAHLANDPRLTEQGIALGTPEYMSPEIIMSKELGPTSDLYSLGCIAYAMMASRPPFCGGSAASVMASQVTEKPEHIGGICKDLPLAFQHIVMKLLEKEPSDRYPDAYAVIRDLDVVQPPGREATGRAVPDQEIRIDVARVPSRTASSSGRLDSWKQFTQRKSGRVESSQRRILYEMEELTGKLETIEGMMDRLHSFIEIQEESRKEVMERIQQAIDELAEDASMKRYSLIKRREALTSIEPEGTLLHDELMILVETLLEGVGRARDAGLDEGQLVACERLGELARKKRIHDEKARALEGKMHEITIELEDIGSQIAALTGRFKGIDEETHENLAEHHSKLASLERESADIESRLAVLSARIDVHGDSAP
jgi:serine/threonine-protein kinase